MLGNKAASGTAIIDELGAEHMRTGALIVYTSADSVFQIAAHEEVVPIPELYRACEIAYELVGEGLGVGRVIARPFVGAAGHFKRTANRHDYALPPSGETLLDRVKAPAFRSSRSARSRICSPAAASRAPSTRRATTTGWITCTSRSRQIDAGLIFANLVDFDTQYGHRNDVAGYAANLERFDARLAELLPRLRPSDLLIVTADHGNDPTTPSTDHSREYVPLLVTGAGVGAASISGTRQTFADLGQTLAEIFGVGTTRARHELSAEIRLRRDPSRTARSARARDSRAAGGQERRLARPSAARKPKTTSGRRSSAIAIASFTARRSAG